MLVLSTWLFVRFGIHKTLDIQPDEIQGLIVLLINNVYSL